MALGLVIQCGLSGVITIRNQLQALSSERIERQQAEDDQCEFANFVQSHIPPGKAVLYVTADARPWLTFFRLSYALYPSTVWWVTPVNRTSVVDWWIGSPVTGQTLSNVARQKEAHYLVLDGIEIPEQLAHRARFEYRSKRLVLRLS
jgi:hypothetical protein